VQAFLGTCALCSVCRVSCILLHLPLHLTAVGCSL